MDLYRALAAPLVALAARTETLETTVAPVAADGTLLPPVPDQIAALRVSITGQTAPPPAMGWNMSNNRSAKRLDAVEPRVTAIEPLTYPFDQQSEVVIAHNRGRYLRATCYDVNGNQVEGALTQPDLNTIQLIFSQPFSGTVVLS